MYLHLSTIITSYEVFIISPYFVLTPEKIQEHIRQSYIAIFRAYCAGVRYRSFKLPTLSFFSNFKQFMNLFQLDILLTLDLNKFLSIFMTKGNLPIQARPWTVFSYSFAIYDSFNMFEDNWRQGFHKNNHKSDWSQLMSKRTTCTPSLKNRLFFVSLKSPNLIIRLILIMSYPFVSGLS